MKTPEQFAGLFCWPLSDTTVLSSLHMSPEFTEQLAKLVSQAMQQAREQAIDEAAERYARPNMMEGDDLWEYDARAEAAIRALKNKGV